MRLRIWGTALCACSLLAGCGGDGKGAGNAEARVRQWLPTAEDIRDGAASAGSHACWTEDGSQDSLGTAARLD
jgi:hypothetical protein